VLPILPSMPAEVTIMADQYRLANYMCMAENWPGMLLPMSMNQVILVGRVKSFRSLIVNYVSDPPPALVFFTA